MTQQLRELAPTLAIFGGLTEEELKHIESLLTYHRYEAGDVIASEGEIGSEMFIIATGSINVEASVGDVATPFVLAECGRGVVLGEMALIEIKPRSASLKARTDVEVYSLTNSDFLRLYEHNLHAYSMVVLNVARELSRRLRRSNAVITECAQALRSGGYKP